MSDLKKTPAIIIGGDFQALGVLRCLAERGIPIVVFDHEWNIAKYSRYKKAFIRSPNIEDESLYLQFLLNQAKRKELHGGVIFANNDLTVYFLSHHKEELEQHFRVTTPSWEITKYLYDKKKSYQLSEDLGIPIPKTLCPEDIDELGANDLEFPVIIKPSIRDHFYTKKKVKAFKAENLEELRALYAMVRSIIPASEILIQEFIPGGAKQLYSFCPLFKNGEVMASITAIRKRQHPMDFGHASTYAETVNVPQLEQMSKKLLSKIHFHGLAEVEFMLDPRDQIFKFIEVNPRIWGWHTLAIGAGVPLPYLLYLDRMNEPFEKVNTFKNMKWVRLTTDIPTVLLELLRGRMSIQEYIRSMRGDKIFAVFSMKDPLPFFMEILMIPYLWIKRGF